MMQASSSSSTDVVIIGAGLSGICAAYYLQKRCPGQRYRILEARDAIGGTWDLFRYPGIRSDSDMFSFGFGFKPWTNEKVIAPAETIRNYLHEAVDENDIAKHITFGTKVVSAAWRTDKARWQLTLQSVDGADTESIECRFLFSCGGYYRYEEGYTPEFTGSEEFQGQIVHPQHWPDSLDCTGKRVTIIGSGATAVTLAPTLSQGGAKVTMLQRSPTWIMSRPDTDPGGRRLYRFLPRRVAHSINRWKSVSMQMLFYYYCQRWPDHAKRYLKSMVRRRLDGSIDAKKHFTPTYDPWDQRICLVPNGDLFKEIRSGGITMVTDHIDRFDTDGIKLKSGEHIPSDIIVTATGLQLQSFGGISISVDGKELNLGERYVYKGMMLNDVPNFAVAVGYTNAPWTLKTELISKYVCRLINHMNRHNIDYCVPIVPDNGRQQFQEMSLLDLKSGYIQRSMHLLPKQGDRPPWRVHSNYILDRLALQFMSVKDSSMHFRRRPERVVAGSQLKADTP